MEDLARRYPFRLVEYDSAHWSRLNSLHQRALSIMKPLQAKGYRTIIYGSVARGDVSESSDVDVFIPYVVSSAMIETTLSGSSIKPERRRLVQATPSYAVKAYLDIDELTSVSFPLIKMRPEELDFYRLAGELTYSQVKAGRRVPGISKQLMLVVPTDSGHREFSLVERLEEAALILGVDARVLRGRSRVLLRRREVGKTGVFKSIMVSDEQSFEEVLRRLAAENPAVRRRMRSTR